MKVTCSVSLMLPMFYQLGLAAVHSDSTCLHVSALQYGCGMIKIEGKEAES